MIKSISSIKSKYYKIAKSINAPGKYIFFAEKPCHDGSPHVELRQDMYHYVVTERGNECSRKITADPEELLYWLTSDLTFSMVSEFELINRVEGEDSRRILFAKNLELLSSVNYAWAEKTKQIYNKILKENPFSDGKQPRCF